MEEMKKYVLGEVCSRLSSGKGISSEEVFESGPFPVIGGNGLRGYAFKSNFSGECGVIGRQGAYCGNVRFFAGDAYMTEHAVVVVGNEKADTRYLTYLLSTMHLGNLSAQSAQPGLSVKTLAKQEIMLPSLAEQKRRASILASLEDKIDLNNRINHNLDEQAQTLYKSWFVDFEPFKGGKFVDSELGIIPEGWEVKNLFEVATLFDSKRKPLSGNERSQMDKIYPYYGATSIMDYVDDYIFDGTYLLMGEDGSVMTEEGFPFLQYVTGKFWPNNHAHVMQGCSGFSTEMLHCALLRKVIKSSVTGAVQAKISQANMKKIQFAYPPRAILRAFDSILQKIYCQKRNISSQNSALSLVRDNMLPRLISGQIDC